MGAHRGHPSSASRMQQARGSSESLELRTVQEQHTNNGSSTRGLVTLPSAPTGAGRESLIGMALGKMGSWPSI